MKRRIPKSIVNFAASLAVCLFMFGGNLSAFDLQLQLGAAGVGIWDSPAKDVDTAFMPLVALQTSTGEYGSIKLEIGAYRYTLGKNGREFGGEEILYEGEIDAVAYSAALLWVSDWGDKARVNVGAGIVKQKYDSSISAEAEAKQASKGVTDIEETIRSSSGFLFVIGMDFFLTENLLLGVSYRVADIKSETEVEAVYPGGYGTSSGKTNFSHKLALLSLLYQFGD